LRDEGSLRTRLLLLPRHQLPGARFRHRGDRPKRQDRPYRHLGKRKARPFLLIPHPSLPRCSQPMPLRLRNAATPRSRRLTHRLPAAAHESLPHLSHLDLRTFASPVGRSEEADRNESGVWWWRTGVRIRWISRRTGPGNENVHECRERIPPRRQHNHFAQFYPLRFGFRPPHILNLPCARTFIIMSFRFLSNPSYICITQSTKLNLNRNSSSL
jgi:hypothetical protein